MNDLHESLVVKFPKNAKMTKMTNFAKFNSKFKRSRRPGSKVTVKGLSGSKVTVKSLSGSKVTVKMPVWLED
jgi:hypothetical protein